MPCVDASGHKPESGRSLSCLWGRTQCATFPKLVAIAVAHRVRSHNGGGVTLRGYTVAVDLW